MSNLIELAKQFKDGEETIREWLGQGAETVPKTQAQDRADVCLKGEDGNGCPFHVPVGVVKEAIAFAIKRQVELKNHLRLRVDGEKSLQKCEGCGCVLKLKIWMPIKNLGMSAEELEDYPSFCWMRKEFK